MHKTTSGLDYQGRHPVEPEAAHAAIDWDDAPMTTTQAIVWWLPVITPAVGLVALAVVAAFWAEISQWLGLS